MHDDRRGDVGHDAQRENGKLEERATREQVDEFVKTGGVLVGRETRLNVAEVDEWARDERAKTEDGNDEDREANLAAKIGGAENPRYCAKHKLLLVSFFVEAA